MHLILKVGRWGAAVVLIYAASWAGFLGYMVRGWVTQWPHVVETLPENASLATNAVAGNWWVLWLFAALAMACAVFVVTKREVTLGFSAIVAVTLLLSVGIFNAMVVSTGFEMLAMAGR